MHQKCSQTRQYLGKTATFGNYSLLRCIQPEMHKKIGRTRRYLITSSHNADYFEIKFDKFMKMVANALSIHMKGLSNRMLQKSKNDTSSLIRNFVLLRQGGLKWSGTSRQTET